MAQQDALTRISTRITPQSQAADPRQVINSAGGHTFQLDDRQRVTRFLITGVQGGTFYVKEQPLAIDNAQVLYRLAATDSRWLVDEIVRVSVGGLAPKVQPALFTLAIAASNGSTEDQRYALDAVPKVARTGTHLFTLVGYLQQFRGWGPALRRAVGAWYNDPPVDHVAYQAVKYRQRTGWTHRDVLRLAHPKTSEDARQVLYDWICGRTPDAMQLKTLPFVEGYLKAQEVGADIPALVREYRLPWEALPDSALTRTTTWDALLDVGLPMGALLRQLPRLTRLGLLPQMGTGRTADVVTQLCDTARLTKARIHPMAILLGHATYAEGHSLRGSSSWTPTTKVTDALDAAFYLAFGNVEPTGKRTLLALDVSGSMGNRVSESIPLTCREVSAAIALVTAAREPECMIVGFTASSGNFGWSRDAALSPLAISPRQRLGDAVRAVSNLSFGGTDCALPFTEAQRLGWEVDTVVTYTDNETWAGSIHPHQALTQYRQHSGIPTRSVVAGMTSTGFTIADPSDAGSLDVVGMDASVPKLISDFSAGAV
jgi:60 kDa SS-A/Ro ribonucleoprotein